MNKRLLMVMIALIGSLIGCSKQADRGDYIIGKANEDNIPKIYVVHHISEKEARTKSLHDFLLNDDANDVILYHVNDINLYNDLTVGERVTVKSAGYIMQSYPPQAVAQEIIRYSEKNQIPAQQQTANSLTLEDVTKTIAEKVELMPIATPEKDWILNNVEPNRFRVGKPAENTDPAKLEQISIYIFRTENERKKGLADFNKQKEAYDMLIPRIYEAQNAMMFYWSGASSDKPTKFGQEFEDAFYRLGN